MNIGIVTPYDSANYGAYLQAYATKKYLEMQGHQVKFIKWRTEEDRKKVFFKKSSNFIVRIKSLLRKKHNMENYNKMTAALSRFELVDIQDIDRSDLDLIVLGSDEIWNINVKNFQNKVFYGGNCGNIPILAYAPSAGNAKPQDFRNFPEICELMNKVSIIGVRDENTANIVHELCNYKPEIVCDPTFLLSIDDYEMQGKNMVKEPYILVYTYHIDPKFQEYLVKFAKEKHIKLVAACMYQPWCDENVCCEPLEFLTLIKEAEYVFTSTFHGSIFTLFQHKKCVMDAKSKKLIDLVNWTNMQSAVVKSDDSYEEFCSKIENAHDYNTFEMNLNKKRTNSRNLYKQSLDKFIGE